MQTEFLRIITVRTPSFAEINDCLLWINRNPKGNSYKTIGKTTLSIKKGNLIWN